MHFKARGGNANTVISAHHVAKVLAIATTWNASPGTAADQRLDLQTISKLTMYKLQKMHQNSVLKVNIDDMQYVSNSWVLLAWVGSNISCRLPSP